MQKKKTVRPIAVPQKNTPYPHVVPHVNSGKLGRPLSSMKFIPYNPVIVCSGTHSVVTKVKTYNTRFIRWSWYVSYST